MFMGSLKNPKDFYVKGGVEAIRAFELVEHRKDCRLILRCKLPKQIFKKIRKNTNIEILQKKVSRKEIEKLYLNSDIFLLPAHTYMLMSTLEAMSFGLPIIGIKSWATSEFIKDGKTGFLIDPQKLRKYYIAPEYPINIKNKFFYNKIKKAEEGVARDIASKINLLLENPSLRRKMGARARKIAQKKFSIKKRTRKLKSLFDKCTNKL
jgi:glycosyltransferase involved in cell wall biosynthesis